MEQKQLPEQFRNLPEHLEGTWTVEGIRLHNKKINKSLVIFYNPRYVYGGRKPLKVYGKIVDHNEDGEPTKIIVEKQLERIYQNLKELKEKVV